MTRRRALLASLVMALGALAGACSTNPSEPQVSFDEDLNFRLEVSLPARAFASDQAIPLQTSVTYLGPADNVVVGSDWSPPVYFSLEQEDGSRDMNGGISGLMCEQTELVAMTPKEVPFVKSGAWNGETDPNADFWTAYFAEKEFRLPAGLWRVTAHFKALGPHCEGQEHRLSASVSFQVR